MSNIFKIKNEFYTILQIDQKSRFLIKCESIMKKITNFEDIQNENDFFSGSGNIQHIDQKNMYLLRGYGGLHQEIEVFNKSSLELISKIDLQEQNFSAIDSNDKHLAIIYRKGIAEIWDKLSWEIINKFTFPRHCMDVMINNQMLVISLYGQQNAVYSFDSNEKSWKLKGYPSIHSSPFLSSCYFDNLVYTGATYEEIFISDITPVGFKILDRIEAFSRYIGCLKVDKENIYYSCEGFLCIYSKKKKDDIKIIDDYENDDFDIDENYLYYPIKKSALIVTKNNWDIIHEIKSEKIMIMGIYVDKFSIYLNGNDGKYYKIPKAKIF